MRIARKSMVSLTILACIIGASLLTPQAQAGDKDLLVYPVRETVVKLAFDIAQLRSTAMVAYDASQDASKPLMHVWDAAAKDWVKTDLEAYGAGDALAVTPSRIFVIGDQPEVVSSLVAASDWCDNVVPISSLRSTEILNALDAPLDLGNHEWKWLAKRHGLTLNDGNEEVRKKPRYYGPDVKRPEGEAAHNPMVQWFKRHNEKALKTKPKPQALIEESKELEPEPEEAEAIEQDAAEEAPANDALVGAKTEEAIEAALDPQPEPVETAPTQPEEVEVAPVPQMPEDK